jgi:hypothetical protein
MSAGLPYTRFLSVVVVVFVVVVFVVVVVVVFVVGVACVAALSMCHLTTNPMTVPLMTCRAVCLFVSGRAVKNVLV